MTVSEDNHNNINRSLLRNSKRGNRKNLHGCSKYPVDKYRFNPLSAKITKWSKKKLKQFVGKLPTNYLSVFDHFVGLALKGLKSTIKYFHC